MHERVPHRSHQFALRACRCGSRLPSASGGTIHGVLVWFVPIMPDRNKNYAARRTSAMPNSHVTMRAHGASVDHRKHQRDSHQAVSVAFCPGTRLSRLTPQSRGGPRTRPLCHLKCDARRNSFRCSLGAASRLLSRAFAYVVIGRPAAATALRCEGGLCGSKFLCIQCIGRLSQSRSKRARLHERLSTIGRRQR